MTTIEIVSVFLIFGGLIFLGVSVRITRNLLASVRGSVYYRRWQILILLTILFMVGYLAAMVAFITNHSSLVMLFTGLIFFLGAFYTFLVVDNGRNTIENLVSTTVSKTELEQILGSMGESLMVITLNPTPTIRLVNTATLTLLGYEEKDVTGKPLSFVLEPGEKECISPAEVVETGTPYHGECFYRKADGSKIRVWIGVAPLKTDEDGHPGLVYVAQDLTERIQAEREIRRQKEFLESVIESLTYPFMVINVEDYSVALANSEAKALSPFPLSTCHKTSHHRDTPCRGHDHPCPLDQVLTTRKPVVVEHTHYDAHYNPRNVEVHCFPVQSSDGEVRQVIEYSIDITERKEMQEALLQTNLRTSILYQIANADSTAMSLEELFHMIHELLSGVINTTNFYIAFYDRETEMLSFPYFVDEVDERPEPKPLGKGLTEYVIRTGKSLLVDKEGIYKMVADGDITLIGTASEQWLGVPLKLEQEVIGVIVVQSYDTPNLYSGRDVEMLEFISGQIANAILHKRAEDAIVASEAKHRKLAEELRQTNNMKELLLDVITHDLKNPAGVIAGMSEMLTAEQPDNEYLNLISDSSESLLKTIQNATTLSKVSLGEDIAREPVDLVRMVRDLTSEFAVLLKAEEMELSLDMPDSLVVNINPILVEVPKNFISNAIKYAKSGKKIEVVLWEEPEWVKLEVRDYGKTIPEDQRDVVFKRSVQLEQGQKRGRGLGLAIVKRIATAHGAEVGVKPHEPTGNIFYCYLPKEPEAVEAEAPAETGQA
ncbi:MAG: PAS domain S-box protein [Candidatus Neomarinimicrobiota bacterium]|nr:MAG: PAS domain S-box protein [Candidatus Neomarinimicrobiota bacterium]